MTLPHMYGGREKNRAANVESTQRAAYSCLMGASVRPSTKKIGAVCEPVMPAMGWVYFGTGGFCPGFVGYSLNVLSDVDRVLG